jgi:hypothetical protein
MNEDLLPPQGLLYIQQNLINDDLEVKDTQGSSSDSDNGGDIVRPQYKAAVFVCDCAEQIDAGQNLPEHLV